MRWRVSAWTHPASASFKLIEHSIPIISGTFTDPEEPRGRCTFIVAASYPWQDLINADPVTPANNRNALIRLYRDGIDNTGDPDQEFYLDRFRRRILDDGTEVILLSGPSWRIAGLDAAVLRWFDWEPGNTVSRQRDWSYGGDDQQNLLRNLDYRGSGEQEKQQYHLHAASGNYTITVPTFGTTGNLQPYEAGGRASNVKTALELVAGINEVNVTGKGHTQFDPLVVEFVDPVQNIGQLTINNVSLVFAGCAHPACHAPVSATIRDGSFTVGTWTRSENVAGNAYRSFHGDSDIEVVTDPDLGDPTKVLKVIPTVSRGGVQQVIENVERGFKSNATVEIYSASTTDEFFFDIRDAKDNRIKLTGPFSLAVANTWETFTLDDIAIPDEDNGDTIIWRVWVASADGEATPSFFHIKTPGIFYGLAAANLGVISNAIIDDAKTDHSPTLVRLPWVAKGAWTAVVDSAAVAWPRKEHLLLRRGKHYGRDLYGRQFYDLGYIHELDSNGATASWDLEVFDSVNHGTTRTGMAFVVGMGIASGTAAGRVPKQTRMLGEGADGLITESVDATQETIFDVWEEYFGDADIIDNSTLGVKAAELLARDLENTIALSVELDASAPVPYAEFQRGDTAQFQAAGYFAKHNRRITDITLSADTAEGAELEWLPSITASKLLSGQAAINEGLYTLLRDFDRFPVELPKGGRSGEAAAGGSMLTLTIAAFNAPEWVKQRADYVCSGDNDQDIIQRAIDRINVEAAGTGTVQLSAGTFNLEPTPDLTLSGTGRLKGMGPNATLLSATGKAGFPTLSGLDVEDLSIDTDNGQGIGMSGGYGSYVRNVQVSAPEICIDVPANNSIITGNLLAGAGIGIRITSGNQLLIADNWFDNLGGDGIEYSVAGTADVLIANNWIAVTGDGIKANTNAPIILGNYISATDIGIENIGTDAYIAGNRISAGGDYAITGSGDDIGIKANRLLLAGISLTATTLRAAIKDNEITLAGLHGIVLVGVSDSHISGNTIYEPGGDTDDTFDGVHLAGDSNDNFITNNKIIGRTTANQPRYGINISVSTCDDNVYVGNMTGPAADYGQANPYNDAGTGTVNTWPGAAAPQGDNLL